MTGEISFDFNLDTKRLERAFNALDDVGAVIRTHYELDRCLTHVLAKYFARPNKLGATRVDPKLQRLEALGFQGARIDLPRAIDDIRNDFAHRDLEELRNADILKLERSFDALTDGKQSIRDFELHMFGVDCRFADLEKRKQFVVIGATAIAQLAALPHEYKCLVQKMNFPSHE